MAWMYQLGRKLIVDKFIYFDNIAFDFVMHGQVGKFWLLLNILSYDSNSRTRYT